MQKQKECRISQNDLTKFDLGKKKNIFFFYILDLWKLKEGTIMNKALCPVTSTTPQ